MVGFVLLLGNNDDLEHLLLGVQLGGVLDKYEVAPHPVCLLHLPHTEHWIQAEMGTESVKVRAIQLESERP